jgi:hypothetical protein
VLVYGYYAFPKPSVQGFPTAADPADRKCPYLVQPPTVPSLAQLRGYHRPPRGGRGRCRRACERTPLRGRRRCATDGRRKYYNRYASFAIPRWRTVEPFGALPRRITFALFQKLDVGLWLGNLFRMRLTSAFLLNTTVWQRIMCLPSSRWTTPLMSISVRNATSLRMISMVMAPPPRPRLIPCMGR